MIKNFDKNKVKVMDFGSNGHYPIPLEKDIVIVQVSVPCYEVGDEVCTYLFQILVPKMILHGNLIMLIQMVYQLNIQEKLSIRFLEQNMIKKYMTRQKCHLHIWKIFLMLDIGK